VSPDLGIDRSRRLTYKLHVARCVSALAVVWMVAAGWVMLGAAEAQRPASAAPGAAGLQVRDDVSTHQATVDKYCVSCHNPRVKAGGLVLESASLLRAGTAATAWEDVVRKLRTRTMPPQGAPRPDEPTYDGLAAWLESELDRAAAATPNPGRPLIKRLNRTEYGNAIRDLLGLDVNVASLLPPDDSAFGFDNISDLLGVSPALLERYLVAADRLSALAVGAPVAAGSDTFRVRQDRSQDQHIDGLPLGTVGGLVVNHTFPLDGEYKFSLELYRTNLEAIRGLEHPHQIEITIDGARVFLGTVGGDAERDAEGSVTDRMDAIDARLQARVPVKAGPHAVGATFVRKIGGGTQRLRPFLRSSAGTYDSTGRPHIETLTIAGPFNPTGPGDTPSRRRVFSCRPQKAAEEESCARAIIGTLSRRAFRRAVSSAELTRLLSFYRSGRTKGSFDDGVQMALRRILASPSFVFRVEDDPASAAPGTIHRLGDEALASRLSFFLWSSIPDDGLLEAAARGQLKTPAVVEQQVRRMLADPRSAALVQNFAGQWLHIRNLRNIVPNHDEFPDFDDTLREAFRREMELFFESIMREDRSVLDLLTADHTFINERLAKHYGIANVYGSHFRRVTLTEDARRGLLGKGSLLMVTSHADRTAPVLRGKWILENVLGAPPPPPPGPVPPLEGASASKPRTLRERMEMHRVSPSCSGCHKVMDPIGFALENYDAVGTWRTHDGALPIDASGQLADGTKVDGVVALREVLVSRSDLFYRTFAEKLLTYALGRGLQSYDMPVVRAIVRDAARQNHRFSAYITGVVKSAPFQMRMSAATK
jgi:mono/diheme cytochrome c family protein